jgi:ubiquinone/menaquinone biosynthesis C-methylase UbiE
MLKIVDYDQSQHRDYASSRRLPAAARQAWAEAFVRAAPAHRPLRCLDLGSGTGRFSPLLAELFGGPVTGVEPSARMRAQAVADAAAPDVAYLEGSAEAIPLADDSVDLVLMFLSFHHFPDRPAAAREIARVLAPGGRVLLRTPFSDRMPEIHWHAYFPRALEIERAVFPSTAEIAELFAPVGLAPLAIEVVREQFAENLADSARRLKTRSVSIFEHFTEAELEEGFRRMDEAAAADRSGAPVFGDSDLMVLGGPAALST